MYIHKNNHKTKHPRVPLNFIPFLSEEHKDMKKKLIKNRKSAKNCVKYKSFIWNIQLLTQSDLFKAKHHLLHIQLMVAMANKGSHCTALLQYAWQLQVYHSEYFHNDISWSIQHQKINFVNHQVFNIYPYKN